MNYGWNFKIKKDGYCRPFFKLKVNCDKIDYENICRRNYGY